MGDLLRTPLFDLHVSAGARMVEFAGYEMPVSYPDGVKSEHLHTRTRAGLFDVSHMGQVVISGDDVCRELEVLLPADLEALAVNQCVYSVLLNDDGGILDDLIVTRLSDNRFQLVINAACKQADLAFLRKRLPDTVQVELKDAGLLALQGPAASETLEKFCGSLQSLTFMQAAYLTIEGVECFVTRSGYTGEDGFEISVAPSHCVALAEALLGEDAVRWAGLGARDSLRLEAGLCLYGHDMDAEVDPVSAGLGWAIAKSRRPGGAKEGGFTAAALIFERMREGPKRCRVGLHVEGRAPVREGAVLVDSDGKTLGVVTSGGFSPSLSSPVAMGYVSKEYAAVGTSIQALVRGKALPVVVSKLPFVAHRYFRG